MRSISLGKITDIRTGKLDVNAGDENGLYPFFTCAAKPYKINEYAFESEAILVAGNGDLNVKYYKGKFNAYQRTYVIQNKSPKDLSMKYLYYFMETYLYQLRRNAIGGIIKYIKLGNLTDAQIPLPPLDDQKRIALLLSKVEGMIARRKQHLQQLDELLKSVFLEMFGDHASMKKQQHYSLGEYIEFLTSGSRGWAKYYADTGSVFLRINNVKEARLKLDDIVFVNAPNSAEATRTRVQAGDLLLSITADLGRTAVVSEEFDGSYINQHLALIRLKKGKGITPLFLAWYFYLPYGNSFIQKKNREGVKAGLNFDDIRSFNIIKPPITLQNQFAATVEKVESLKSRYQSSLTNLENLYGVLSQKAFKGELDLSRVPMEEETR